MTRMTTSDQVQKAERFRDGHVWIGEPARTAAEDTAR